VLISLKSIKNMVFTTEEQRVNCAVPAEFQFNCRIDRVRVKANVLKYFGFDSNGLY
jgi:hypothetical protein